MSFPVLRNFRQLVDKTRKSTGYLISGPEYFRDNVKTWIDHGIQGMSELESSIDYEVTLKSPVYDEKKYACTEEGISDIEIINKIAKRADNFAVRLFHHYIRM